MNGTYEVFQAVEVVLVCRSDERNLALEIGLNLRVLGVRDRVHERRARALIGQRRHARGTVFVVALGIEVLAVRRGCAAT
jgi:hypothetical protein